MKKVFMFFMAATLMISLAGCSANNTDVTPESVPADAEENTDTEQIYYSESEIDTILADAEPVVFETLEEYEEIIRGLGFEEIDLDIHRMMKADGTMGDPTTTVKSLTYKDGYFRMELSYYDTGVRKETDGWVLYGTKATEIADISGIDKDAYEFYDVFNYRDGFPEEYNEYNAEYVDYSYFNVEDGYAVAKGVFFPETGNLYNLVITLDGFPEDGLYFPYVIWREDQLN